MKNDHRKIVVIGASGAIGNALTNQLSTMNPSAELFSFSQKKLQHENPAITHHTIDYSSEASISQAAHLASRTGAIDMVIVATGLLHDKNIQPEKSLTDLKTNKFLTLFMANTIVPALIAKHFLPHLNKQKQSIFAALSARVGSISDNKLGGWYAYRSSKAALNMVIKNAAIELKRTNKLAIIIGLHPGTVDSELSKPFQKNLATGQLFTPTHAAQQLSNVLNQVSSEDSGKCFAWDGKEVLP